MNLKKSALTAISITLSLSVMGCTLPFSGSGKDPVDWDNNVTDPVKPVDNGNSGTTDVTEPETENSSEEKYNDFLSGKTNVLFNNIVDFDNKEYSLDEMKQEVEESVVSMFYSPAPA